MNTPTAFLVFIAIISNVLASIFLKQFSLTTGSVSIIELPMKSIGLVIMAMIFYVVAFIVYAMVLRTLPVSKAYTLITFGAQVTLIAFGALVLGEKIGLMGWTGLVMVFFGLMLVSLSIKV